MPEILLPASSAAVAAANPTKRRLRIVPTMMSDAPVKPAMEQKTNVFSQGSRMTDGQEHYMNSLAMIEKRMKQGEYDRMLRDEDLIGRNGFDNDGFVVQEGQDPDDERSLKKNFLKKIFGYLARCDFLVKLRLRVWIFVGYVEILPKFGLKLDFTLLR